MGNGKMGNGEMGSRAPSLACNGKICDEKFRYFVAATVLMSTISCYFQSRLPALVSWVLKNLRLKGEKPNSFHSAFLRFLG